MTDTMETSGSPTVDISWPVMPLARYAAFERATGVPVANVGDIWWRQVRPFVYRPLLPFQKYDLAAAKEQINRVGVFQHGVVDGQAHNSYLNPIVFDDLPNYDMKLLRKNVRSQIKKALQSDVKVARILDAEELVEKGYTAYLSFFERTQYAFESSRRQKDGFARWIRSVFEFEDVVVLGSYSGSQLLSFEISCLVEGAVVLKTIVNSDQALKLYVPDLMLHHTRVNTARQPNITIIYDSMLNTRVPGINDFKMLRGAKVVAVPAFLHMHPALRWVIKTASKAEYGRLLGLGTQEVLASGASR